MHRSLATRPALAVVALVATLALVAACAPEGEPLTADATDALALPGGAVRGLVRDTSGLALAGVRVTAAAAGHDGADVAATTNADGAFLLRGLRPSSAVRLGFRHPDHAPSQQTVAVHDREVASAAVVLKRYGPVHELRAEDGGEVAENGFTVHFPAGGLVDAAGAPVTGPVTVRLATLDVTTPEVAAAPGDYIGRGAAGDQALTSFGMVRLEVQQDGQEVELAPGQTLTVALELPPSLLGLIPESGDDAPEVPAWVFDEEQGAWVQTGTGTVRESSAGGGRLVWIADLPTTQLWYNCDHPQPSTCVRGRVTDCAGNGIPGARVQVDGVSYTGTTGATSGPGGRYEVRPVALGAQVKVVATLIIGGRTYTAESGPVTTPTSESACLELPEVRVAIPDVSGLVWLTKVEDRSQNGAGAKQIQASAMFRDTLGDALPSCGALPPLGSCTVLDTATLADDNPAASVPPADDVSDPDDDGGDVGTALWREPLLDVGNRLELSAGDETILLQRRVGDGGPTYASQPRPALGPGSASYKVTAPFGGADLDAFQVSDAVRLPEPLALVGSTLPLPAGGDLRLQWGAGDETTSVSVTLTSMGNGGQVLYCLANDTGQLSVPRALIAQLGDGDLSLTIARSRAHYFPQPDGAAALASGISLVTVPVTR